MRNSIKNNMHKVGITKDRLSNVYITVISLKFIKVKNVSQLRSNYTKF